ncbi:hypothetical protein SAMN04487981_101601 [Streptomyces sp. cf386]|uniref:hypothetical protein n=1 Tax=Streptomyces sp. cf386 TaxID=1761904 RepID=UPI0008829B7C|nr:hypothetical protein [Streptomyces sp. cf386]SDM46270.1 hypothetical protein SAMN04487981_101601 [Streptomyces sp. cf386]
MTAKNTHESWDAFWAEVSGGRTEIIRGVEVTVPTDMPLGFQARLEQLRHLGEESPLEEFEDLVSPLFGEGTFGQWVDAGMGSKEFLTAITWGMAQAKGTDMSFREAYEIVTSDDPGKAAGANRATRRAAKTTASSSRSAAGGGRSKPTSRASTGSSRKTSQR